MDVHTPQQQKQQRPRKEPYRRAGDVEYAKAFLAAGVATLHGLKAGDPMLNDAAARRLRVPIDSVNDVGRQTERAMADMLQVFRAFIDPVVDAKNRLLATGLYSLDSDEGRSAANETAGDLRDYGRSLFEYVRERLAQAGQPREDLSRLDDAWRLLSEKGGDIEDGAMLLASCAYIVLELRRPAMLASFLAAHQDLTERTPDVAWLTYFITRGFLDDKVEVFLAAAAYDRSWAEVAVEAYLEVQALDYHFIQDAEEFPPNLIDSLFHYYVGRRTEVREILMEAHAALVYGPLGAGGISSGYPRGPVFEWALRRYGAEDPDRPGDRVLTTDGECAAYEYCDAFLRTLDGLPVEALLASPGRAIKYARAAAVHAVDRVIAKYRPTKPSDDWMAGRERDLNWIESVAGATGSLSADERVRRSELIQSVPDYDLLSAVEAGSATVTALANARGISKQAMSARLKRAKTRVIAVAATGLARQPAPRQRACAFLDDMLGDGPRLAADVEAEAERLGISVPTLTRARRDLGVITEKVGFQGPWLWSLPGVKED